MRLTTPSYVLQNLCLHEWTQTHCVYILSDFMNFAARLFVLEGFFFFQPFQNKRLPLVRAETSQHD